MDKNTDFSIRTTDLYHGISDLDFSLSNAHGPNYEAFLEKAVEYFPIFQGSRPGAIKRTYRITRSKEAYLDLPYSRRKAVEV